MREVRDWDENYLLSLPVGEFDWLEVKGRRGLDLTLKEVKERDVKANLSRAISAFANSGGGVLALGLENPQAEWHVDDGGIDLAVKDPSTREWLEDITPTLVDFPLHSFNVYVVQQSSHDSDIAPGRGIFLIEIPDSEQAPHQATDKRYYARVAGKSRPIGHRLVMDIFGRRRHPAIELEFAIEISSVVQQELFSLIPTGNAPKKRRKVELIVRASNVGRVYTKYVNSFIYIPVSLVTELQYALHDAELEEIDGSQYFLWVRANIRRDVVKYGDFGPSEYGPSWFDPILPGLAHTWRWDLPEDFDVANLSEEKILWEVHADNAPRREGSIMVRDIGVQFKE